MRKNKLFCLFVDTYINTFFFFFKTTLKLRTTPIGDMLTNYPSLLIITSKKLI